MQDGILILQVDSTEAPQFNPRTGSIILLKSTFKESCDQGYGKNMEKRRGYGVY
jgi:hypothetical protein